MTPSEIQESLLKAPLFREFTAAEVQSFVELLDPLVAPKGGTIVRQDDPGDSMYVLVSGHASVLAHQRDGTRVQLAVLEPGDFFGELALVDKGPRSADVEAIDDCVLLGISQAAISALAGVYPNAAFKFLIAIGRIMVDRLRHSNQRYIDSILLRVGKD